MNIFFRLLKIPPDVFQIQTLIDEIDYKITTHIICVVDESDFEFLDQSRILDLITTRTNMIELFNRFLCGDVINDQRTRVILYCSPNYILNNFCIFEELGIPIPTNLTVIIFKYSHILKVNEELFPNLLIFLTKTQRASLLRRTQVFSKILDAFDFKQIAPAQNYNFSKHQPLRWVYLTYEKEKNFDVSSFEKCDNCNAVIFPGEKNKSCCANMIQVKKNIDIGEVPKNISDLYVKYKNVVPNYARIVNMQARPVITNAMIKSPYGEYGCVFVTGIPYAYDGKRQFLSSIYAVASGDENIINSHMHDRYYLTNYEIDTILHYMLCANPKLKLFCQNSILKLGGDQMYFDFIKSFGKINKKEEINESPMNAVLINTEKLIQNKNIIAAKLSSAIYDKYQYESLSLDVYHKTYDRLLFPLIFVNGVGGCGKSDENEKFLEKKLIEEIDLDNYEEDNEIISNDNVSLSTLIRYTTKAMLMQGPDHWIHQLGTLREEYMIHQYAKLIYIQTEFQIKQQKFAAKEK